MQHTIVHDIDRPPCELLDDLRSAAPYPVAYAGPLTGDAGRPLDSAIKPLRAGAALLGPAVTVTIDEPDHLIPMYAIEVAKPGDILVISVTSPSNTAVWGGSMTKSATTRQLEGVVIDGAVCDSSWLSRAEPPPGVSVPVFARAVSPAHAGWARPGSINVPIVCGGVPVSPGDLVVGGDDGVVVVPRARLAALRDRIVRFAADAAGWHRAMDEGRTWFDVLGLEERLRQLCIPGTLSRPDGQ